ncbi:TPA: hypothetical protein KPJ62_002686 [Clostridioides difficile]|nr:hypothetical protein [Clostridioides difficile]
MSETREKDNEITISITSTYQKDSEIWTKLIEPLKKKRELAPFTKSLLSLYAEDEEFRNLADKKIKEKSLPERVNNRINKISENHHKAMLQAQFISDVIVSQSININNSTVTLSEDNPFDTDGLLESLSKLLPSEVRKKIEDTIEETYSSRLSRLEALYTNTINSQHIEDDILIEESVSNDTIKEQEYNDNSLINNDDIIQKQEHNNSSINSNMDISQEQEHNNSFVDDSVKQEHNIIREYTTSSVNNNEEISIEEDSEEEKIEILDDSEEDENDNKEETNPEPAPSLLKLINSAKKQSDD